ncbi:hypothetical protein ACG33_04140 [Steroidobacter denitrificans]|uniref:DUF2066 domain-containing protein n=1 Tax=Steroidobacter denitrificans TaxID=465721 RepID=A0A127F9S2_STEDE|nr:DUF2066 domain-containing protein [Steroidobacter denitrificans]AMN46309.1 hypothetical protein ACG33_04140 [Steroidobacter denitrificans]
MAQLLAVLGILPAALLAPMSGSPAWAATVPDLYEAVQPLGTSHDAAFVEALKSVVVRVSGQRDAPERLGAALNSARQHVQRFGQTSEGLLQVRFDAISIDRLLTQAGLPIWGHERPAILVLLDIETDEAVRQRIAGVARERGLPLRWPLMDTPMTNDPVLLRQAAARYGANATLRGHVRGGLVHWTLLSAEGESDASGGWDEGVHLAADTFARVFAVSGSALDSVTVEVSGIAGLDAYAATLNYLEGMTLVRSVALEQVVGDTMRFRLLVRGGAATLRRAIALDDRLVPQGMPAPTPATSLAFRYRP